MERFFYQKRRNLSKECTPARPACAGRVFLRLDNLVSAGGKGGFDCLSHVDFLLDFAPEPVLCCILSLVFWQARAFTSNEKTGTDSHPLRGQVSAPALKALALFDIYDTFFMAVPAVDGQVSGPGVGPNPGQLKAAAPGTDEPAVSDLDFNTFRSGLQHVQPLFSESERESRKAQSAKPSRAAG